VGFSLAVAMAAHVGQGPTALPDRGCIFCQFWEFRTVSNWNVTGLISGWKFWWMGHSSEPRAAVGARR